MKEKKYFTAHYMPGFVEYEFFQFSAPTEAENFKWFKKKKIYYYSYFFYTDILY